MANISMSILETLASTVLTGRAGSYGATRIRCPCQSLTQEARSFSGADLLILTYDVDARSFSVALDKTTGQVRWQAERTQAISAPIDEKMESLSTPILLEHQSQCQLVNHSWGYLCGYELPAGKELWHLRSPGQYIIVSPVLWNDLMILGGGEGAGRCLFAVRLGEDRGMVKPTEAWRAQRNLPETASPVVYGRHVYTVTRGGVASCLEARDGKVVWVKRLRGQYDASITRRRWEDLFLQHRRCHDGGGSRGGFSGS